MPIIKPQKASQMTDDIKKNPVETKEAQKPTKNLERKPSAEIEQKKCNFFFLGN
jgi:hypothetical protein